MSAEVIARKIALNEIVVAETMAEEAGQFIGYLRLEYRRSTIPYIELIRVREEFRGRGIARAILAYVEGVLRGGGHLVLLSSSRADEPAPQAWHRAAGFGECGIRAGIDEGGPGELFFRQRLRSASLHDPSLRPLAPLSGQPVMLRCLSRSVPTLRVPPAAHSATVKENREMSAAGLDRLARSW